MTETFLQNYWWVLVSFFGGLLVALIFVLGANLLLANPYLDIKRKRAILKATARRWLFAFAALVAFGCAVFFAFPLFFRIGFWEARWVWILLLATFVFQWVLYAFCYKTGNLLRFGLFRFLLVVNGFLASFLVGATIGTFFTGSGFIVLKTALAEPGSLIIKPWGSPRLGLEALGQWHAVLLGITVVALTVILGALFVIRNVDDHSVRKYMRRTLKIAVIPFLLLFSAWFVVLMLRDGFAVDVDGVVSMEPYKYLQTFLNHRAVFILLVIGSLLVLTGLYLGMFTKRRRGFVFAFPGTILVVMAIFFLAGFNDTAYYPSLTSLQSSLTIRNSSAGFFTLQTLFRISLLVPFVIVALTYAWFRMDRRKTTVHDRKDEGGKD